MDQVFKNSDKPWGVQVHVGESGLVLAYPGAAKGVAFSAYRIKEKARTYHGQNVASTSLPKGPDEEDQEAGQAQAAGRTSDEEGEQARAGEEA